MIEGKFYANRFRRECESLKEDGFHLGVGERYLLRRLSQEYAYHCLREDFQEVSWKEIGMKSASLLLNIPRADFIVADILSEAAKHFAREYIYKY